MDIVIKVTVPKEIINADRVRDAIERKMRSKTAPDLQRLFKRTTQGWEHQPGFDKKFSFSQSKVSTTVYTDDDQYALVNAGSPPHDIYPRNAPMLRFQRGYRAATRPRVLSSRAKSRFGSFVRAPHVSHPGFTAREFDQEIAKQYESTFRDDMQDAIREGTR